MNPLNHAQFAQDTHREYEAKYGARYTGDNSQQAEPARRTAQTIVLALSGVSLVGALAALISLF